jgi:hypothetical protein
MLPPLLATTDPGFDRPLVIDGMVLSVMPRDMDMFPEPESEYQKTLGADTIEWQRRPGFDGVADHQDSYVCNVPFAKLAGTNRTIMELIRVTAGPHLLTVWRMVPMVFTCKSGVQRYYWPKRRKCAAHFYAGLDIGNGVFVDTDQFKTLAYLNDVELTVIYAEGPTLIPPAVGSVVISRLPDADGIAKGYTAMLLGDAVANGDVLKVWSVPTLQVSMRSPRIRIDLGQESHSYVFAE